MKKMKGFGRWLGIVGILSVFSVSGWAVAEVEPNDSCGAANVLIETNTTSTAARQGSTVSGIRYEKGI